MITILAIALAGALGSVLRYLLGRYVQALTHLEFPIGTLMVNVVGCALVGAIARYFLNNETQPVMKAALVVGFCGGFTTFSSFGLETLALINSGNWPKAMGYVAASTAASLSATALGFQFVLRR
jgi:CrcB protein